MLGNGTTTFDKLEACRVKLERNPNPAIDQLYKKKGKGVFISLLGTYSGDQGSVQCGPWKKGYALTEKVYNKVQRILKKK